MTRKEPTGTGLVNPEEGEIGVTPNDIIESQRVMMTKRLRSDLGLFGIQVGETTTREPEHYAHRPTLGLLSGHDVTTAILVSASLGSTTRPEVDVLYIAPGSNDGTLGLDPKNGKPYADFFFEMDGDGNMIPVRTTAPVPIDLLVPNFSDYGVRAAESGAVFADDMTHDITCYKGHAIPVFLQEGIPQPMGGVLTKDTTSPTPSDAIDRMVAYGGFEGIVVKDPEAHRSTAVGMYDMTEEGLRDAKAYADEILNSTGWVIVQERVIPAQLPLSKAFLDGKRDWNLRSVVFMDGSEVAYVGAFIRHAPFSNRPVSLSTGAESLPLPEDGWLGSRVREFTEDGMRKLAKGIQTRGGKPQGVIAFDIVVGGDSRGRLDPKVIEPNGWKIGGIAEMVRLAHKPLASIPDRVIPLLVPRLQRNYQNRAETSAQLRSVPISEEDVLNTALGLVSLDKRPAALQFLKTRAGHDSRIDSMIGKIEESLKVA